MSIEGCLCCLPAKGRPAREHVEGNDGQAVNIAAAIDRTTLGLLRRHVFGCTQHHACLRAGHHAGSASDAEVGEQGVTVATHQNVAGLDVTMDDAALVRVIQGGCHLGDDADSEIERK